MTPQELEQQRIHYVRVTNNLPFTYTDRFDGVPFTLRPGKTDNIPPQWADHMFGFKPGVSPDQMLRHIAKRQGWNTSEFVTIDDRTGKTKAQEYFEKLVIVPVAYKFVPAEEPDPREPVPADPEIPQADAAARRPRPSKIAP